MGRSTKLLLMLVAVAALGGIVAQQQMRRDGPTGAASTRTALALTAAKTIRQSAKNPDSIKFVSMNVNEAATVACAEYRGTNSFNAVVKQFTVFVDGVGFTDDLKAWNRHCTKGMFDLTPAVR